MRINNQFKNIAQPINSVFCGGYALASILYDETKFKNFQPSDFAKLMYEKIQSYQIYNDIRKEIPPVINGTSLPSAVARVAQENGFDVSVYCNNMILNSVDGFGHIYYYELNDLSNFGIKVDQNSREYFPPSKGISQLILVKDFQLYDDGQHCISANFDGQLYYLYNSASGSIDTFSNEKEFKKVIYQLGYSHLYIELS